MHKRLIGNRCILTCMVTKDQSIVLILRTFLFRDANVYQSISVKQESKSETLVGSYIALSMASPLMDTHLAISHSPSVMTAIKHSSVKRVLENTFQGQSWPT